MHLFDIPSGLVTAIDANTRMLERIALAFERISPPVPLPLEEGDPGTRKDRPEPAFSFAESPEEYQARTSREAEFALSLGVAPWSPEFQNIMMEMRQKLITERRMERDEEGNAVHHEPYTEQEAEAIIRQAFQLAKAEANTR